MRIVVGHNFYRLPGGEDIVFETEVELLRSYGHTVESVHVRNEPVGVAGTFHLGLASVWSYPSYQEVYRRAQSVGADVVHFHNTFPRLSPSCYYAAKKSGAAVVQTLHNYRLLCPGASLYRDGSTCEDCAGREFAWPSVVHKCYRQSRAATVATAAMLLTHRVLGTWSTAVDSYITLTDFAREKFIMGGIPPEKICVKPNFVRDERGAGQGGGGYVLFVGRLVEEKGILTLLDAWQHVANPWRLRVVGDGPLSSLVEARAKRIPGVEYVPVMPHDEVFEQMKRAELLVVPSSWFEPFGLVVVEAFASGCPVIASDIGGLSSLVRDGVTGLLFSANDPECLARRIKQLYESPALLASMRHAARAEYEAKYTAERNYGMLMDIYSKAIASARAVPQSEPQGTCEPAR